MKSLVHTEELCSRSVPLEHAPGAKSLINLGKSTMLTSIKSGTEFFGRCFSRHGRVHLSPGYMLSFHNAPCQSQQFISFVPLHYIDTCCRCDLQSAAENATNTRVPSSPAPVDAGKVLGRVVSANAGNS